GRITNWNPERGFGFVTPAEGGERVFLHITAISDRRCVPSEGGLVTYDLAYDERKRPRAINVKPSAAVRQRPQCTKPSRAGPVSLWVASLFMLLLIAETLAGSLPPVVMGAYSVLSIVTFVIYWDDKAAAQHGRWRTQESSLFLLGLAGGWPGAVVAQQVLRH